MYSLNLPQHLDEDHQFDNETMGGPELNDPATPAKIKVQIDPKAAYTFGHVSTLWERMKLAEDPDHPFCPFCSADEFEIIEFLATANLSQGATDRFLRLSFVSQHHSLRVTEKLP